MSVKEVKPGVFFYDTPGTAANVFFIKTSEGVIWIDTTMTVEEVRANMEEAGISLNEVILLINTHADIDHIGGNSLFPGPKLAHYKTLVRMQQAERPAKELPTQTFTDGSLHLNIGGYKIELIYMGGHKPDQTSLWLPEQKVLIPSDLVFEGRYPFMMGSDVPAWAAALRKLSDFDADVILPGHGTIVGAAEINLQLGYMETTWEIVAKMRTAGKTVEEILKNPDLPRVAGWEKEDFFERNILEIVEQLSR
ncbi:MBL fold metallo-hydrolase [bacterium]|nr:MBL fold metallo-hydrolase [bacterium]MCB2179161.1 MBL fold metallo-hydrolase [bacterium]